MHDDGRRVGVVHDVGELDRRVRRRERNRHAAGPPDAPLDGHVDPPRRREEADAFAREVRASRQETPRDGVRRAAEVRVGERAFGSDDGDPAPMPPGAIEER
jgi:hypothetical protein